MRLLIFLIVFIFQNLSFAQVNRLGDSEFTDVNFRMAADNNYALKDIVGGKANFGKPFTVPKNSEYCWLQFSATNNNGFSEKYYLQVYPDIENTVYFFDKTSQKWNSQIGGFASHNLRRQLARMPFTFQDSTAQIFYVKVRVAEIANNDVPVILSATFFKAAPLDAEENLTFLTWIASIAIILTFFLYNLYIYFIFKDRAYLYYLLIQLGALFYITSYRRYLNVLFPERYFYLELTDHGLYSFDLNIALMQVALILIIFGFVEYSRTYLETKILLPILDKILRMLTYSFVVLIVLGTMVTLSKVTFLYRHTVKITNLLIVAILILIFTMGIIANNRKLKQAKYFLIANSFPMLMVLAITVTFVMNRSSRGPDFLPNIAIISQTLAFALALVARINVIKDALKSQELETQLLRKDNEQIQVRNQLIAMENQYVNAQIVIEKTEKDKLQEKLEFNQRELASTTLYLFQKNEMLTTLQKQIDELPKSVGDDSIRKIKSTIKSNLYLDADWEKFKVHFEKVHPDFFTNLKEKHPTLTPYEIRLCAYFHLQLSPKEIAGLLNINATSVHRAKLRLNNKLNSVSE